MPGFYPGGDCTTYYFPKNNIPTDRAFGIGGGLPGIIKGKLAGESIAKYLSKI